MNINRIRDIHPRSPDTPVTVKRCGNVVEVRYMARRPPDIRIEKLSADLYTDKTTGEVKAFQHHSSRSEDTGSLSQSLRKLRDLINANLAEPENALWVTLTYRENMRDPVRLYEDYRRFWQRFQYHIRKQGHPAAEYIIAAEPQGRGAWHLHCLFLFPSKAPYISNSDMARIWGQCYTKTQSLKGIGNPGLYLTAYLGDMELTEAVSGGQFKAGRLRESKDQSKAVIKGARLKLYPAGFNIYRFSRDVERPEVQEMTEGEAQREVSGTAMTYEKTISITDADGKIRNIINYRTYTKAPAEGKTGPLTASQRKRKKQAGTEGTPKKIPRVPRRAHLLKKLLTGTSATKKPTTKVTHVSA